MVERVYRCRDNKPSIHDALQRLQDEQQESQTPSTDIVRDWLQRLTPTLPHTTTERHSKPTVPSLPPSTQSRNTRQLRSTRKHLSALQPTQGNRIPHPSSAPPPPDLCATLKRKMPGDFETFDRDPAKGKTHIDPLSVPEKNNIQPMNTGRGHRIKTPSRRLLQEMEAKETSSSDSEPSETDRAGMIPVLEDKSTLSTRGRGAFSPSKKSDSLLTSSRISKGSQSRGSSPTKSNTSKGPPPVTKREQMELLTPAVRFWTMQTAKDEEILSGNTLQLWLEHVRPHNKGIIPSEFKDRISTASDTPTKSRVDIPPELFGSPLDKYTKEDHTLVWMTVSDVLENADKYRHSCCTEAHWISVVVSPLLHLVRRLKRHQKKAETKLEVLDMTTVEVKPASLCPTCPEFYFRDLDKRIDQAIGLDLPSKYRRVLARGEYKDTSPGALPSINQTASFVNFIPMYIYFEIKRPNTDKDPLIQLGAFSAAEITKRRREGYALDMPVLAVEVVGDLWNIYIVFATEDNNKDTYQCNFVGPLEMGTTNDVLGIFKILNTLCRCADWGIGPYRNWFLKEILAKYREA